jgi:hypothetical protein
MAETALIAVDMDISAIHKRLAEIEGSTKAEARVIRRELAAAYKDMTKSSENAAKESAKANSRAMRNAERDAKRSAAAVERSFREQTSAVRGLSTAAFGGMAGDLFDVADASAGVSGALGAVGLALGALAVAPVVLGGMVTGLKEVIDNASESADALRELGPEFEALVSPATLAALTEYDTQMERLGLAADVASVEIGAALVPFVQELTHALVAIAPAAREAAAGIAAVYEKKEQVQQFSRVALGGLTLGVSELARFAADAVFDVRDLTGEFDDAAKAAEDATESMADQAAMLAALGMTITDEEQASIKAERATLAKAAADRAARKAAAEHRAAAAANRETVEESTTATKTYEEAMAELEAAMNGAQSAIGITDEQSKQFNETLKEQRDAIMSEEGPTPFQQMTEDMLIAGEAALSTAEALTPIMGNLQQLAAIEQRQHEDRVQQLRDQRALSRETYRDAAAEYDASRADMTQTERIAQEDYLARLAQSEKAKRDQLREFEREERAAAMEAYRRQKALQLVQIAIDSARNAVALTPAFAYAGPYAPLIAAGIATAQGTTAAALVASQPPPAFHFGTSAAAGAGAQNPAGIVGAEVPAVLEQGEGVISRRGMAAPGMAELVQMVNEGRAPSERSRITDTEADMLAQRLNRPYAPNIRGRAEAGRNTFYRGR